MRAGRNAWNIIGAAVLAMAGVWALIIAPIRENRVVRRARLDWLAKRDSTSGEIAISDLAASSETWSGIARVLEDLSDLPASTFRPGDPIDALDDLGCEPLDIMRPLRRAFAIRLPTRRVFGSPWGEPIKPTFACLHKLIIEEKTIQKTARK